MTISLTLSSFSFSAKNERFWQTAVEADKRKVPGMDMGRVEGGSSELHQMKDPER